MTDRPDDASDFSGVTDRTLYFTLSLHIDNDLLGRHAARLYEQLSGHSYTPGTAAQTDADARRRLQLRNQRLYPAVPGLSLDLRNAMEPMFSDVADRERLGVVEDYLLAIAAEPAARKVTNPRMLDLRFSPSVAWQTEGEIYRAELARDGEAAVERAGETDALPLRRFWFVHRNNSLSYHFSLKIERYTHTPQYFFLFSILQKLVSPKEFLLEATKEDMKPARICRDGSPSLAPFTAIMLRDSKPYGDDAITHYVDFWQYVLRRFEADFHDLYRTLVGEPLAPAIAPFHDLLTHKPYIEVPGLEMPSARCMFYFADQTFRDLLLPRLEDGSPAKRHDMLREVFFDTELEAVMTPGDGGIVDRIEADHQKINQFGPRMWDWFAAIQQRYEAAVRAAGDDLDALTLDFGPIDDRWLKGRRHVKADAGIPGLDPAAAGGTNLALSYLFLAGFNQNIIDFVNQDASEVLDSLDPIYPFADDDVAEGFFARYANPRTLITFVKKMRSLDAGDEYIGTCPYAFLIHLLTLHNEFLTRDFEDKANEHLVAAKHLAAGSRWVEAAEKFYEFRQDQVVEYDTFRYDNVFRYDTERKVFLELQQIRGIDIRHDYVMALVEGAERRTRDNEERKHHEDEQRRREDERELSNLVTFVGVFSVLQVLFQATDAMRALHDPASGALTWLYMAWIAASGCAFAWAIWLGVRIIRKRRNRLQRKAAGIPKRNVT